MRQFIGRTLYANKLGFNTLFPCSNETLSETDHTLRGFVEFFGLPMTMHSDNHKNFKEGIFMWIPQKFGVIPTYTEPHSPWHYRAEPEIGEFKLHARMLMLESDIPIRLWCFCYEYITDILSLCDTGRFEFQGQNPYETVMNYTPNISEYASF